MKAEEEEDKEFSLFTENIGRENRKLEKHPIDHRLFREKLLCRAARADLSLIVLMKFWRLDAVGKTDVSCSQLYQSFSLSSAYLCAMDIESG